jgi:hypothetical protein
MRLASLLIILSSSILISGCKKPVNPNAWLCTLIVKDNNGDNNGHNEPPPLFVEQDLEDEDEDEDYQPEENENNEDPDDYQEDYQEEEGSDLDNYGDDDDDEDGLDDFLGSLGISRPK